MKRDMTGHRLKFKTADGAEWHRYLYVQNQNIMFSDRDNEDRRPNRTNVSVHKDNLDQKYFEYFDNAWTPAGTGGKFRGPPK